MRTFIVVAAIALVATTLEAQRVHVSADALRLRSEACTTATMSYGDTITGSLEPSDCKLDDGTSVDFVTFSGHAGEFVGAMLRVPDVLFTKPVFDLIPPQGDDVKTPTFRDGSIQVLSYILDRDGIWTLVIGTSEIMDHGRYDIQLSGDQLLNRKHGQNCVGQWLLCGETMQWDFTPESCRFDDGSGPFIDVFNPHDSVGRPLDYTFFSNDVAVSAGVFLSTDATYSYKTVSVTAGEVGHLHYDVDWGFLVLVWPTVPSSMGSVTVTNDCQVVCAPPKVDYVQSSQVRYGATAQVFMYANGSDPIVYEWYEGHHPDTSHQIGNAQLLQIPNVTEPVSIWLRVWNRCGSVDSNEATITPGKPSRHRGVAH